MKSEPISKAIISKVMREMGRKGGKAAAGKGGKLRMASLTPEQRKELAQKAANARWAKAAAKRKPNLLPEKFQRSKCSQPTVIVREDSALYLKAPARP